MDYVDQSQLSSVLLRKASYNGDDTAPGQSLDTMEVSAFGGWTPNDTTNAGSPSYNSMPSGAVDNRPQAQGEASLDRTVPPISSTNVGSSWSYSRPQAFIDREQLEINAETSLGQEILARYGKSESPIK